MFGRPMTTAEIERLWDCYAAGETAAVIARKLGRPFPTVNDRIREAGGVRPVIPKAAERSLTIVDREEISRGLAAGESIRCIAARLGRPASTVSREITRNGGVSRYRATTAEQSPGIHRQGPDPYPLRSDAGNRPVLQVLLGVLEAAEHQDGLLVGSEVVCGPQQHHRRAVSFSKASSVPKSASAVTMTSPPSAALARITSSSAVIRPMSLTWVAS